MEPEHRDVFQIMSLGTVLGTMGIANHLDNWIELLLRFHTISSGNEFSSKLLADLEAKPGMGESTVGMLFAIGSSNLTTVAKLEQVFDQLDQIEPKQRRMLYNRSENSLPITQYWSTARGLPSSTTGSMHSMPPSVTGEWLYGPPCGVFAG